METDPVKLIGESLVLPTEQPYGKSWEPWQKEFFEAIFATVADKARLRRKPTTRPRFRLVYSERRRGESKTEDVAAVALADLLTGPDWHRSYCVAADADQAALIIDSIRGFQSRSPILEHLDVQRTVVRNPATSSELRVMSADDRTAYGIKPRRVYFDELSLQPDDRLWTAMWSAIGKNPQSQMVAVSMAGSDMTSIGYKVRELTRTSEDYYFHTRQGSELAPWLSQRDMDEQEATLHPADFARYWRCEWVEPKGSWITVEMYNAAERGQEAISAPIEARCVGFVDVGLVHDATAIAVCHADGENVALDTLRTMQGRKSEPVSLEALEAEVIDLTNRYHVSRWIFEAPQAAASVERLTKTLRGAEVTLRYPTAETQANLWGNLYRLFSTRRLVLFPHQQLRREALNLVARYVSGRLKPTDSSAIHQDHVLAVGGAAEMISSGPKNVMVFTLDYDPDRGDISLDEEPKDELEAVGWPDW